MLEREGHESHRLQLRRAAQQAQRGIFEGAFHNAPTGKYRAWIVSPPAIGASPTVDFTVESPPGETALARMNAQELRRAAGVMKTGHYYTLATAHELLDAFDTDVIDHKNPRRRCQAERSGVAIRNR